MNLKVSVITVCLNNENLEKTINSVANQTFKNYDHWIIDNLSDNAVTINILDKYKNQVHIISEKDAGIYDAMNKGIKLSKGEYLIFLNAGDFFFSKDSLNLFAANNDDREIVYGDLEFIQPTKKFIQQYPSDLKFSYFLKESLPHPACFIKRSVFEKIGFYATDMLITADWAFFVAAICLHKISYKHLPYVISSFDHGGLSSLTENWDIMEKERQAYLEKNFDPFLTDYIENEEIKKKYYRLKNSRLRKYLAYFFKQLQL